MQTNSGIIVKGVIHWVSSAHAVNASVKLYDRLFKIEDPAGEENFKNSLNENSLQTLTNVYCEPSLHSAKPGETFQFIAKGYFCVDTLSNKDKLIFNRTVTLKDTWQKVNKL